MISIASDFLHTELREEEEEAEMDDAFMDELDDEDLDEALLDDVEDEAPLVPLEVEGLNDTDENSLGGKLFGEGEEEEDEEEDMDYDSFDDKDDL